MGGSNGEKIESEMEESSRVDTAEGRGDEKKNFGRIAENGGVP